ncbi:MAG TPA: hypothetical protein VGF99_20110, partial [Myxococcota bacterium]
AIRRSPDGTHLALGTPPLAVDLDSSLVEATPGAWATTWAEVYVVDGEAVLWRADLSLDELTPLGTATDVLQNADTAIAFNDAGADIYDKHSGERVAQVPGGTSGAVDDDVVTVHLAAGGSAAWTGTTLLRGDGSNAKSNAGWILFNGTLYHRATEAVVATTGRVLLIADDDRYIEHDFDHVAVGDADGVLDERCRRPDNGSYNIAGFGRQYVCFNDVFDVDGTRIFSTVNGAQLYVSQADDRFFFAQQREGSNVFNSTFQLQFKNGRLLTGAAESMQLPFVDAEQGVVVTRDVRNETLELRLRTDAGTVLAFDPTHDGSTFARRAVAGVLLTADDSGISAFDFGNTRRSWDIVTAGQARDATSALGEVFIVGAGGALSAHRLTQNSERTIDAGPFDTVVVIGDVVIASVAGGPRAGLYTFARTTP